MGGPGYGYQQQVNVRSDEKGDIFEPRRYDSTGAEDKWLNYVWELLDFDINFGYI